MSDTPDSDLTSATDLATQAAPGLAWSAEEPEIQPLRHSWGQAWGAAAVLVMCCAVVALVIWAVGLLRSGGGDPGEPLHPTITATMPAAALPPITPEPAPAVSPAPPPPPAPPTTTVTVQAAPPPPTTVTVEPSEPPAPSKDDQFIQRLEADKLVLHDRAQALASARWVCRHLAAGRSQADIVPSEPENPTVTHLGMVDFVSASADFYCPEYAGN